MKSKRKIGRDFEIEAFEYLKNIFEDVIWLSENKTSCIDFKAIKDGKEVFIEAKCINSSSKPLLKYSQREADYVLLKNKNKIKLIEQKDFEKEVCIQKYPMVTITIKNKTWKRLSRIKYNFDYKNLDEIISGLLEIFEADKLKLEKQK